MSIHQQSFKESLISHQRQGAGSQCCQCQCHQQSLKESTLDKKLFTLGTPSFVVYS